MNNTNTNNNNTNGLRRRHYIEKATDLKTIDCPYSEEQETTINISRVDSQMTIFTSDNTMLTKIRKKAFLPEEEGSLIRKDWKCWEGTMSAKNANEEEPHPTGYFFLAPKKLLSFRGEVRVLTEEEKMAAALKFKNAIKKQQKQDICQNSGKMLCEVARGSMIILPLAIFSTIQGYF